MDKISCVIIAKNELDNLKRLFPVLKDWIDEIVLVDSGSSDGTADFAKSQGASVFYRDFDGYGPQKHWAVNQAKNDWILSLDADEIPSPELIIKMREFLKAPGGVVGVEFPYLNVFLGRVIDLWGTKDFHLRLFRKSSGNYDLAPVHELVQVKGKVVSFREPVFHYSYKNLEHYLNKFNTYTTLGAKSAAAKGKRSKSLLELFFRPGIKFFALYFLRGGFRFGTPGFVWCFYSSIYPVTKYLKLYELHQSISK